MAFLDSYDGIIFDYGGVLVFHQTEADQARMAEIAGIRPEVLTQLYWAERFDYDKDAVSGFDYWRLIGQKAGVTLSDGAIADLIECDNVSWMQYDPVMWEWVEELRAIDKRLAILSNMPRELGVALTTETKRFEPFHYVTLSYELRTAKPEPAIYQDCLKGMGTAPERTLFLDDRLINVRAAEEHGMHAIQFTSREDVLPKLRG